MTRSASIVRNTSETQIELELNIDGQVSLSWKQEFLFLIICLICLQNMGSLI